MYDMFDKALNELQDYKHDKKELNMTYIQERLKKSTESYYQDLSLCCTSALSKDARTILRKLK